MSNLAPLLPEQFPAFFRALWGYDPFPWQVAFAISLCSGNAPDYVTVPTGSGKTACLDGALFALAVQAARPPAERTVGRRIFFIVNRRIIVDEAFERAGKLARKLRSALAREHGSDGGIIAQTARWLSAIAGGEGAEPLSCAELRGGIYRDRAWAKSIIQPMILCSTVDQAGSRLLFRGYGVSPEARPIHAALVAQDSLLLIDEAHISQPFVETLHWVKRYRTFRPLEGETVALPFALVCLTATPPRDDVEKPVTLELADADREHPILKARLTCKKPAQLVRAPKAKGKQWNEELAKELVAQAASILNEQAPRSIAIMVNRVATARAVYALANKTWQSAKVTLLLGRMRPLDRDKVTRELQADLKTVLPTEQRSDQAPLRIVVSTQCLEVGADFDFDALITECASLDALRQRFGRLNRGGRPIVARAAIVLPEEQNVDVTKLDDEKPFDPIYGNAIPRTWAWLQSLAAENTVDFGLSAMTAAANGSCADDEKAFASMLTPVGRAPVLLPAYLDCWAQTNPRPAADPDVALFLHGPQRDMAEVQVCWRADLPSSADEEAWGETLALCPPTALECLPVPLHLVRRWLENGGESTDTSGDAPQVAPEREGNRKPPMAAIQALLWRGADESRFISDPRTLRPGDTIVLRLKDGGWASLGHVPDVPEDLREVTSSDVDCAEEGQARMRSRAFVRLHLDLWSRGSEDSPAWRLMEWAKDEEFEWNDPETVAVLNAAADALEPSTDPASLYVRLRHLAKWAPRGKGRHGLEVQRSQYYPGAVLTVRELLPTSVDIAADAPADDSADDPLLETAEPQSLDGHTLQVTVLATAYADALGITHFAEAIHKAGVLHDVGKADRRFQALLIGSDVSAALARPIPLAKSASIPSSRAARELARRRATLPVGFRHEMLSLQLASRAAAEALLPAEENRRQLALHLIASHHGHARPFAPVVDDDSPPPVSVRVPDGDLIFTMTADERRMSPSHALDSGIADRFWHLTRHHGWWGLALLEAVLRLADQTASAHPSSSSQV